MVRFQFRMGLHRVFSYFYSYILGIPTCDTARAQRDLFSFCLFIRSIGFGLLITLINILLPAELVKNRLIVIEEILVAGGEPLNDFSQHALPSLVYQAWNHFISDILSWGSQHLLKLTGWKSLNDDILLLLLDLILLDEVNPWFASGLRTLLTLLFINAFQQSASPFFHFDQSGFKPLPKFIVLSSPHIRWMPHVVFYELLNLILPLYSEHMVLDALDRDHESWHIFYQHIIPCNEQLLLLIILPFLEVRLLLLWQKILLVKMIRTYLS
jgi:hypothetical protein